MKHFFLFLALLLPVFGQKIGDLTNLPGANVDPAADKIPILDDSANLVKRIDVDEFLARAPFTWLDATAAPYNATGDGTTDDTAAIQAAIDAADVGALKTVYLPAGNYRITSALTLPERVHLIGESATVADVASATRLTQSSTTAHAITMTAVLRQKITNIEIQPATTSTGYGINVANGSGTFCGYGLGLDSVHIKHGFARALYVHSSNFGTADHCIFNSDSYTVYLEGLADTWTFQTCAINGSLDAGSSTGVCVTVDGNAKGVQFIGCEMGNAAQLYEVLNGSLVTHIGGNVETITGDYLIRKGAARFHWIGGNVGPYSGNVDAVVCRSTSTSGRFSMENVGVTGFTDLMVFESNQTSDDCDVKGVAGANMRYQNAGFSSVIASGPVAGPVVDASVGGSNLAIGTGAWTTIVPNVEDSDPGGNLTSGVFTASKRGYYDFDFSLSVVDGTTAGEIAVGLYQGATEKFVWTWTNPPVYGSISGSRRLLLAAGDTVTFKLYHAKGSNLNLSAGIGSPRTGLGYHYARTAD